MAQASDFEAKAEKRKNAINQYCWSPDQNWYVDVDLQGQPSKEITLAGVAPLFFKVAPSDRVDAIVKTLKDKFVQPGGVVTTLKETGQQWDSPNGWAPLQWLTIQGLRNYGQDDLAKDLAERWMKLNVKVYNGNWKADGEIRCHGLVETVWGRRISKPGRLWMDERRIFRACMPVWDACRLTATTRRSMNRSTVSANISVAWVSPTKGDCASGGEAPVRLTAEDDDRPFFAFI